MSLPDPHRVPPSPAATAPSRGEASRDRGLDRLRRATLVVASGAVFTTVGGAALAAHDFKPKARKVVTATQAPLPLADDGAGTTTGDGQTVVPRRQRRHRHVVPAQPAPDDGSGAQGDDGSGDGGGVVPNDQIAPSQVVPNDPAPALVPPQAPPTPSEQPPAVGSGGS